MSNQTNTLLGEACNGVTLEGAIQSAIQMTATAKEHNALGKEVKAHKLATSAYLYGLLATTNRAQRVNAVEAFGRAVEATGELPKEWRKSSSLATKLSEAKRIAETLSTAHYLQTDTFGAALQLARKITSEREEQANSVVAEQALIAELKDIHGDRWEVERIKLRAQAVVEGIRENTDSMEAEDRELLFSYIIAGLEA